MIFFIFGILALLAAFCLFRSEYKAAAVIPGALAAVLIVISCVSFVPTGYTGIVTTFGKVENGTKDAGVVVKAPWQSIVKMDNRVQEVSIDLSAFSSDIQEVATSVTVGYRINQANAMTIYKEVGRKYEDVLILPRVPEVVKAVVAHYDASSLISNRDAVAEQMDAQLRSVLAQYNIDLSYISITNFDFTDLLYPVGRAKPFRLMPTLLLGATLCRQTLTPRVTCKSSSNSAQPPPPTPPTVNSSSPCPLPLVSPASLSPLAEATLTAQASSGCATRWT